MTQRTYCPGCGTHRFKDADALCSSCDHAYRAGADLGRSLAPSQRPALDAWLETHNTSGAGQPAHSENPQIAVSAQPVTFGGHQLDAPGFTAEQFERAIARALVDELEIHYDATGAAIACHKGVTSGYRVTRSTCSCKAGDTGTPCKHRAALIFHQQVREPAIRCQWQATERATRKAVAA